MRTMYVGQVTVRDETGAERTFRYDLLIGAVDVGGGILCEGYGIQVTEPARETGAAAPGLTVRPDRIEELVEALMAAGTGPDGLRDAGPHRLDGDLSPGAGPSVVQRRNIDRGEENRYNDLVYQQIEGGP